MRMLGEYKVFSFLTLIKGMREGGEPNISVLPQGFGSLPAVFAQTRWCNLVHVECLQMIKPMVVRFCSIGG